MKNIKSIKNIDRDYIFRFLTIIGGTLFFARELNIAIFVRLFSLFKIENNIAVTITSFIPFLFSVPLLTQRYKRLKVFYLIYFLVLVYFGISILLNLDNLSYYFRPRYGVQKVFLPSGGMFAIYYILLLYDKEHKSDLLHLFIITAFAIFSMSLLQYIAAKSRGYWLVENLRGEQSKLKYSLSFGFNMAFAVNLFIGLYNIRKKHLYLLFASIGFYTIITDGNRMALVLPIALYLVLFIYLIVSSIINKKEFKRNLLGTLIALMAFVLIFATTYIVGNSKLQKTKVDNLTEGVKNTKEQKNKTNKIETSRTLDMLRSGNIFNDNARKDIHSLVYKGVSKNPILGLGAFGDRPLVAPKYVWGHSHGIHMEVWSNLGMLLGIPFVIYLANTFFAMMLKSKNIMIIMYFVFVGTASLHLTSLSFWIEYYIWGLIAFSILSMNRNDYWIAKILGNKVKE